MSFDIPGLRLGRREDADGSGLGAAKPGDPWP